MIFWCLLITVFILLEWKETATKKYDTFLSVLLLSLLMDTSCLCSFVMQSCLPVTLFLNNLTKVCINHTFLYYKLGWLDLVCPSNQAVTLFWILLDILVSCLLNKLFMLTFKFSTFSYTVIFIMWVLSLQTLAEKDFYSKVEKDNLM